METATRGMCSPEFPETGGAELWDEETYHAINGGRSVHLTCKQAAIFKMLAKRKGRIVTYDAIFDGLYWRMSEDEKPDPGILSVFVSHLRKKLATIGLCITSQQEVGYVLHDMEAAE